jgi:4-oxalocrotonate tautomerase
VNRTARAAAGRSALLFEAFLRPMLHSNTMREAMPLVKIHLRAGKPSEYVASIGESIHQALVTQADVPADDRFQIVFEQPAPALVAHPTYGGVRRTEDLVIVEIILNAGRSVETKKSLYADMARRLGMSPGIRPDDLLIVLVEVVRENWSFGGGKATYA